MNHAEWGLVALAATGFWLFACYSTVKARNHSTAELLWSIPLWVLPFVIEIPVGIAFHLGTSSPSVWAGIGIFFWYAAGIALVRLFLRLGAKAAPDGHH